MEKTLTEAQVTTILKNAPKGTDPNKIVEGLVSRGYILQGFNDQPEQKQLVQQASEHPVLNTAKDVVVGAAKGLTNTLQTVASPITNVMEKASGQKLGFSQQELAPTNTAQKIGKGVEQVAEFAVPGAAGLKVAKVPGLVNLAARVGTEALGAGATTLAQTGDLQQAKDGAMISGAFPVAGKALDSVKNSKLGGKLINSLIKTKQNDLAFGKNPGKTVAELGITGNTLEGLIKNIGDKKKEIGTQIGTILNGATAQGVKLSLKDSFGALDEAIAHAKKAELSNAPLITKLENLKTDLTKGKNLDNLSPDDAFKMKQNVAELTKFTGNPSDDKAANSALMNVYGKIKDAINTAIPDKNLAVLNDHYGNLLTAEKAGAKRAATLEGQNVISLGGKTSGTAATVLSLLSGTAAIPAILTGIAVAGGEKVLSSPAVKTRVAKWLANKTAAEKKEIFKAAPYLKGLIITNSAEN